MADVPILLPEYAKGREDPLESALIEQFATSSDVLEVCPFKAAPQGANEFFRQTDEPTVGFRAVGSDPEVSTGNRERLRDQCYPISGLLEADRIILKRYGEQRQRQEMKAQMSKAARVWTDTFINGDNSSDPKEFSGLKTRLTGTTVDGSDDDSRLLANSTASGGAALSLSKLDLAIRLVAHPTHILMNRKMHTALIAAARNQNVSGHVIHTEQEQGRQVTRYAGIPILVGYEVSKGSQFLPFNEVAYGGGSANTTSIYVVSLREDGVCGIQTSPPEYIAVDTDRGVQLRDLFEWDTGITQEDHYSAIRLSSIQDAAIVA